MGIHRLRRRIDGTEREEGKEGDQDESLKLESA